jgi:hypothetical protein
MQHNIKVSSQGASHLTGEVDKQWMNTCMLRLHWLACVSNDTHDVCYCACCRYQHDVGQQLTISIACPGLEEAAATAAAVWNATAGERSTTSSTSPTPQPVAAGAASGSAVSLTRDVPPESSGPVLSVLLALMAWADQLKTTEAVPQAAAAGGADCGSGSSAGRFVGISVVLDERQHGTQSLLHPGLARLQGDCDSVCFWTVWLASVA